MADPSEEEELFDSDDDGLPLLSKILAPSRQVIDLTMDDDDDFSLPSEIPAPLRQVIDLTIHDDDDNGDGDGNEVAEVRWFRNGRPALCHVRLIPPPLIDDLSVVDQLSSVIIVLLSEMSRKQRCRSYVVHSGHTWRQEIPLEECPFMVPVARQTATAFRCSSSWPDRGYALRPPGQPWVYLSRA